MEISLRDLRIAKCLKSFHFFALWAWGILEAGKPFHEEKYFRLLCDEIEKRIMAIGYGIPMKGLCVHLPPAIGKSILFSKLAPVWALLKFPSMPILCASMNTHLALSFSTDSRSLVEHPEFTKYFDMPLRDDVNSKNKWMNEAGGSRTSIGLDTPSIGSHAWLQIIDDPQSMNSIHSEIDRNRINSTITSHLGSRTGNYPGAQQWVIQQRLSKNDVSAYLESFGLHDKICLPAELNDTCTHPELYTDGLLAPKILPQSRLDRLRIELGSETYQANFNQNPSASEFAILKEGYFDIIPEQQFKDIFNGQPLHIFFDGALSAGKRADYSAALATVKIGDKLYITDMFRERLEYSELKTQLTSWIHSLNGFNNNTVLHIEPKASGLPLISDLRIHSNFRVVADAVPTESKEVRVQAVSARIQNMRVCVVKGPWNNIAIQEWIGNSSHDDLLDCLTAAISSQLPAKGVATYKNKIHFTGGSSSSASSIASKILIDGWRK